MPPRRRTQNWSRPITKPISVGSRKLRTLDDLRTHLLTLSDRQQGMTVWQYAIRCTMEAAEGGDISRAETSFRLARMLDGGGGG